MKNIILIGFIMCLAVSVSGCGSDDLQSEQGNSTNVPTVEEKKKETINPYTEYKNEYLDNPLDPHYAFFYVNERIGSLFNEERAAVEAMEKREDITPVSVKDKKDGIFAMPDALGKVWGVTKDTISPYTYKGELKNNQPNGVGIIYYKGSPICKGFFKDGMMDGYAQIFSFVDKSLEKGWHEGERYLSFEGNILKGIYFTDDSIKYVIDDRKHKFAQVKQEIEKKERTLPGYSSIREDERQVFEEAKKALYEQYKEKIGEAYKDITFVVFSNAQSYGKMYYNGILRCEGDIKNGVINGNGIVYFDDGSIEYKGEIKNNKYNGKGKLYYPSGKLKYEGEFKNDLYDGNGTSYDENGTVEYEGKWKSGDYAY